MIHGPFDDRVLPQAEAAYMRDSAQTRLGGAPNPEDIAEKTAYAKRDRAAQRAYELTSVAQQLEHLRLRLIALDLPFSAKQLDIIVIELMQRWVEERERG